MKKKSPKTKAAKQKKDKEKQEDSAKKTKQTPKKKATFELAEPEEAGEKKNKEEVAVCLKCVVGLAIRIDKGNNAKGGFDKKISKGLTFLREYLDKATCILPSGKDRQLSPTKTKADLLKYQVIMKNYFNIPNPMAFSNVSQEGGRRQGDQGFSGHGFLSQPQGMSGRCGRGLTNDGLLIVLQEVPGGGHSLQFDTAGSFKLN